MEREFGCFGPDFFGELLTIEYDEVSGAGLDHEGPLGAKPLQGDEDVSELKGSGAEVGDSLRKVDIFGTIVRAVRGGQMNGQVGRVIACDGSQIAQDGAVGEPAVGIVGGGFARHVEAGVDLIRELVGEGDVAEEDVYQTQGGGRAIELDLPFEHEVGRPCAAGRGEWEGEMALGHVVAEVQSPGGEDAIELGEAGYGEVDQGTVGEEVALLQEIFDDFDLAAAP